MIELTRLNGKPFMVNNDLIETIEETPDTIVTLTTGRKLVVLESAEDLVQRIVNFRMRCSREGRFTIKLQEEGTL